MRRFWITLLPLIVLWSFIAVSAVAGQSIDQSFPTAVRSNEIVGSIKARDIGDARLTTYYFAFNGDQGDIFVNVVTKNFDGDIDIFIADGLRPLTKIVIFADASSNETGRIVYLRKSEKLLLRIQGRTPNDDPAAFRVKFAGSFVAIKDAVDDDVAAPKVTESGSGSVRVNSVGTIIEMPAKPVPPVTKTNTTAIATVEKPAKEKTAKAIKPERSADGESKSVSVKKSAVPDKPKSSKAQVEKTKSAETTAAGDPMAAFRLVVVFKDGKKIERQMTDVIRFTVDNGTLTVIFKDGYIGRYPMAGVLRVGIE